jgi:hypothetical protein
MLIDSNLLRVGDPTLATTISQLLESRGKYLHPRDFDNLNKKIKEHFILFFVLTLFGDQMRLDDFQAMSQHVNAMFRELDRIVSAIKQYIQLIDIMSDVSENTVNIAYIDTYTSHCT